MPFIAPDVERNDGGFKHRVGICASCRPDKSVIAGPRGVRASRIKALRGLAYTSMPIGFSIMRLKAPSSSAPSAPSTA
ncbi:hypothetical protein, partial [Mesorhizobium sp. B4-1-3]|uniref:hypothetical protein n=1 Tax=Mesorhizobium sp. B4-1-3 TaxID=2589889 RepID=UPI001AEEB31B